MIFPGNCVGRGCYFFCILSWEMGWVCDCLSKVDFKEGYGRSMEEEVRDDGIKIQMHKYIVEVVTTLIS